MSTYTYGNAKPRILIINGCGRLEGDIFTILLLLRHSLKDHFDVYVVSKPRGEVYENLKKIKGITIIDMEMGGNEARKANSNTFIGIIEAISALLKMTVLAKHIGIDIIYTIDRGIAPKIAALVSRLSRITYVLCAAYPFYPQNGFGARFVLRQASRILVHSNYLRSHLLPYVKDSDRFKLIPYGIEIEHYNMQISDEPIREQYGINADDPVVVMMGRLDQYKGQDDFIKAAKIVLEKHPNSHFLISGRGSSEFKAYLEGLITDLNLNDHVRLVGYVPSLPHLIAASDIVAMPSWEEPFGLVALEGMAMGKPIVSTNAGGVPEFVLNNEVGLLVRPRDPEDLARAIIQLLSYPERAKDMGQKGRQQVEKFYTVNHYSKGVVDTLYDVIHKVVH